MLTQQHFIQFANNLGLFYPQLAELFQVGNNTIIISYKKCTVESSKVKKKKISKEKAKII